VSPHVVAAAVVVPLAVLGVLIVVARFRRPVPDGVARPVPDATPVEPVGRAVTVVPGRRRRGAQPPPARGARGPRGSEPEAPPADGAAAPADPAVGAGVPEPGVPEPGRPEPTLAAERTAAAPGVPAQPPPVESDDATQGPQCRGATQRQQAQLAGLRERLDAAGGRHDLAASAMHEAARLVGADTSALVVRSVVGPRVLAQHPAGTGPELWGVRTLAALLATPEPVRLALAGDPLAGGARTALVTAPVPAGGGSVGVVVARRRSGRPFTASDQDALARLARITGARLHLTPERTAVVRSAVDRATGLGCHDLLMADLTEALRSRPEHGLPATLVAAEIVGLARFRTARGMAAADTAVAGIAARVGSQLRLGDLLYRTNADELAVLLPATDATAGAAVARRLDATVADETVGLSLRSVTVPVEGSPEAVMLRVMRTLAAARVSERWAGGPANGRAGGARN
jgi:GGDEF domain-containing protein